MRTDPEDVARVESKTFICTERREDTIPSPAPGVEGTLGKWESPDKMKKKLFEDKFPGCMKGRARSLILFFNYISQVTVSVSQDIFAMSCIYWNCG